MKKIENDVPKWIWIFLIVNFIPASLFAFWYQSRLEEYDLIVWITGFVGGYFGLIGVIAIVGMMCVAGGAGPPGS